MTDAVTEKRLVNSMSLHFFLKVEVEEDERESVIIILPIIRTTSNKNREQHCRTLSSKPVLIHVRERYLKVIFIFSVYR